MLDEILDQENIELASGRYEELMCWHRCSKNDQRFIFGLDSRDQGLGYYLVRDGKTVASGSKSALISALERYGLLHELDPKVTQRIFMDVRC